MYLRNLRKPAHHKNIFKFASFKNRQTILCESALEFDTCFHFEYNSQIAQYHSQPEGFQYQLDGETHSYTPDFASIDLSGKMCFWEVKPSSKIAKPQFIASFSAKQQASQERGFALKLVTERQIRQDILLNNLKLLHRYRDNNLLNETQHVLLSLINHYLHIEVAALADETGLPLPQVTGHCLKLVSLGLVRTDLSSHRFDGSNLLCPAK